MAQRRAEKSHKGNRCGGQPAWGKYSRHFAVTPWLRNAWVVGGLGPVRCLRLAFFECLAAPLPRRHLHLVSECTPKRGHGSVSDGVSDGFDSRRRLLQLIGRSEEHTSELQSLMRN